MNKRLFLALACLIPLISCTPHGVDLEQLKADFVTPPPTARPGVYWYFMDGNMSKEGMTKDLESMKDIGIGYVVFLEVNVGVPRGEVDFMSDEWLDRFKHAVSECERLGIQMILGIGPGWTGSGGPWVKGEQSMQHLVSSVKNVTGGKKVETVLDIPEANPPFFGEGAFTPKMRQDWLDFYQDVAVLAFPTPKGSGRIEDVKEKALYVRAPFSSQPGVKQYLESTPSASSPEDSAVNQGDVIDITSMMDPDGKLVWDAPEGEWTIMRFGSRNNGNATRPAPTPGVGMECDKFSKEALEAHFANFTDKLFAAVGDRSKTFGGIKYLHMDSWEMGAQNWTPAFREEFRKRRGYDPQPFYPVYSGIIVGDLSRSERFLYDVRLTSQELVIDNHALAVKEYAHRHGALLSIEPYDMNPTADLELAVSADVPMAEYWANGFGFHTAFAAAEGSSAAHLIGQNVVPAESFTSEGDGWRQYPGLIKDQTDWAFGAGINRLVFHTFQHQCLPDSVRPGMTMGPYGIHWDRNQTWWEMSKGYHTYVQRCQQMLQQGRTVADILYLTPESIPHVFKAPSSAYDNAFSNMPDRKGYSFDACPPSMIYKASVRNGRIVFPSGAAYAILLMPEWPTATPALLEKIHSLAKAGATIVGRPPKSSPSLSDYPACDEKVLQWNKKIWGDGTEKVHRIGKGRMILLEGETDNLYLPYSKTAEILASLGIAPDIEASSNSVRYTHRTLEGADLYFVSNRTDDEKIETITFRVTGMKPELWDPVTGRMRTLPEYSDNGTCTVLDIKFQSHQAFFVVFTPEGTGVLESVGNNIAYTERMVVETPWTLAFNPEWGTDDTLVLERLVDWTTMEDPLVKYYSGTAAYETTFEFAGSAPVSGIIDLGCVKYLAHVWLNGEDLGYSWVAPFRLDLAGALRQGSNTLRIEVANLWQNRIIGDLLGAPGKRRTFYTWNHYRPEDPILESGLTGPVTILESE